MGVFLTCSCKKEFKTRGRSAVKGVGSNSSEMCYFDVVKQTKYFTQDDLYFQTISLD